MSPGRSGPRRAANEARLPFRSSLPGLAGLVLLLSFARPVRAAPPPQERDDPIPLLAYYYIWFDPGSWERAKADLPLLGRYSSDDKEVMRQHVQWAKEVGIDGFIVSWKSTDRLNQRLDQLVEVAAERIASSLSSSTRVWISSAVRCPWIGSRPILTTSSSAMPMRRRSECLAGLS